MITEKKIQNWADMLLDGYGESQVMNEIRITVFSFSIHSASTDSMIHGCMRVFAAVNLKEKEKLKS